jgi:hypothetical protein
MTSPLVQYVLPGTLIYNILNSHISHVLVHACNFNILKGLSHEIDFKKVDENGQILAKIRAAAGF